MDALVRLLATGAALLWAGSALAEPRPALKPSFERTPGLALLRASDDLALEERLARAWGLADAAERDLIIRQALLDAPATYWRERLALAARRPTWPGARRLRLQGEAGAYAARTLSKADIASLLASGPISSAGVLALADALKAAKRTAKLREVVRRAWREVAFDGERERAFLAAYGGHLRDVDHERRLRRLLDEGERDAAARQLRRTAHATAADALRIDYLNARRSAERDFARLDEAARRDPGLLFERGRHLRRRGRDREAAEAFVDAAKALKGPPANPGRWRSEREILVRRLLAQGEDDLAYEVAGGHGLSSGYDFSEAEFLAGWIALRRLGRADAAAVHFERLEAGVDFALSRAKAAYWRGRADEALGSPASARDHFMRAAMTPESFYGRLASDRLAFPRPAPTVDDPLSALAAASDHESVRILAFLIDGGAVDTALRFVDWAVENGAEPEALARLAERARAKGAAQIAVRLAKAAVRFGGPSPAAGHPAPPLVIRAARSHIDDPALVLAHARQESEFDADAVSSARARGLMQFIAGTARATARKAGLPYEPGRIAGDPTYAAGLGAAHIAQLLDRYDGAFILAIAAYNAGPRAVDRWIAEHGDPRGPDVDPIDWIELISYSETRSYVQRVLENLMIYRERLGVPPRALADDFVGPARYARRHEDERLRNIETDQAPSRAEPGASD